MPKIPKDKANKKLIVEKICVKVQKKYCRKTFTYKLSLKVEYRGYQGNLDKSSSLMTAPAMLKYSKFREGPNYFYECWAEL